MNREIKFRDFDLETKEMRYFPLDKYDNEYHDQYGNIMQYTGLKDNNGKEIYDGDVIMDLITKSIMEVCFGYNRNGGYNGWYCKYLNVDRNGYSAINGDYGSNTNKSIEILGNIYQNPELLNL